MKESERPGALRQAAGSAGTGRLKPAGLLFDMDGVLVDSLDSWYSVFAGLFRERLQRELSKEEFQARYWARDLRDIFTELQWPLDLGPFCRDVYRSHLGALRVDPAAERVLAGLARYPKAIITNTPAACTRQILGKFRLERFFPAILTGEEVKRGKPDPEIVLLACRALGIPPAAALLIGDSELDLRAGRAAGCPVIGLGIEADYRIQGLGELLDLIEV